MKIEPTMTAEEIAEWEARVSQGDLGFVVVEKPACHTWYERGCASCAKRLGEWNRARVARLRNAMQQHTARLEEAGEIIDLGEAP